MAHGRRAARRTSLPLERPSDCPVTPHTSKAPGWPCTRSCAPSTPDSWRPQFVVEGTFTASGDLSHGYLPYGIGLYRKHFTLPAATSAALAAGSHVAYIEFDGAQTSTDVYVNGVLLGKHASGYTPFHFRLEQAPSAMYMEHLADALRSISRDMRAIQGSKEESDDSCPENSDEEDNLPLPPLALRQAPYDTASDASFYSHPTRPAAGGTFVTPRDPENFSSTPAYHKVCSPPPQPATFRSAINPSGLDIGHSTLYEGLTFLELRHSIRSPPAIGPDGP